MLHSMQLIVINGIQILKACLEKVDFSYNF